MRQRSALVANSEFNYSTKHWTSRVAGKIAALHTLRMLHETIAAIFHGKKPAMMTEAAQQTTPRTANPFGSSYIANCVAFGELFSNYIYTHMHYRMGLG